MNAGWLTFYNGWHEPDETDQEARRRYAKAMGGTMLARIRRLDRSFDRAIIQSEREGWRGRPIAFLLRLWLWKW